MDTTEDRHFYFWFFESRSDPTTDPLILWLNGGPGCSSFTGLLMELGPCNVNRNGSNTIFNRHSWNNNASIIFLDQPVGTGFSYSNSSKISTSQEAAKDMYVFLRLFKQAFSKYSALPFHIAGESYAGHYIPWLAKGILVENENNLASNKIALESIAIGNGFTDSVMQNDYYVPMLRNPKYGLILPEKVISRMELLTPICRAAGNSCYRTQSKYFCVPAELACSKIYLDPYDAAGLNFYDVRLHPNDPILDDYSDAIEKWVNQPFVLQELGAHSQHVGCDDSVYKRFAMAGDGGMPVMKLLPSILEKGIRVLIYAGDADYICNWMGNKAWVLNLNWFGSQGMKRAKDRLWKSIMTGRVAGEIRTQGNFSFLNVYNASHFVPFDQPEHSLEMINNWLSNTKFNTKGF